MISDNMEYIGWYLELCLWAMKYKVAQGERNNLWVDIYEIIISNKIFFIAKLRINDSNSNLLEVIWIRDLLT